MVFEFILNYVVLVVVIVDCLVVGVYVDYILILVVQVLDVVSGGCLVVLVQCGDLFGKIGVIILLYDLLGVIVLCVLVVGFGEVVCFGVLQYLKVVGDVVCVLKVGVVCSVLFILFEVVVKDCNVVWVICQVVIVVDYVVYCYIVILGKKKVDDVGLVQLVIVGDDVQVLV